jgi:hypothetical protein
VIPFTLTFSEDVAGFGEGGLAVANGSVSNFAAVDARTYTFDVTPDGDGLVTVTVTAGAATDAAGNGSAPAALAVASDRTAPTAEVSPTAPGGTVTGTADDGAGSGVSLVEVSVRDPGGMYSDPATSDFTSAIPVFVPAADTSGAGTWATWSFALVAPDGDYAVEVRATDAAGNQGTMSATVTVSPGG